MANRVNSTIEQGRTYDIDFMNWESGVEGESFMSFGDRSKKATGMVKAVNKFVKILLTKRGSDPFNRTSGTDFDDLHNYGGYSEEELGGFISVQMQSALDQVRAIQSDNSFREDETITSVELVEVEVITVEKIRIYMKIRTEAGVEATINLPIVGG